MDRIFFGTTAFDHCLGMRLPEKNAKLQSHKAGRELSKSPTLGMPPGKDRKTDNSKRPRNSRSEMTDLPFIDCRVKQPKSKGMD